MNPIIYLNDKSPNKGLPETKFSKIIFLIKQIIKIIFSDYINKKNNFNFIDKNEILLTDANAIPINLVINESYSDYRLQTSRDAIFYHEINSENPAEIFSGKISQNAENIRFSICLNGKMSHLSSILVEGYYQLNDNFKESFEYLVPKETISGFSKPTYWLDILISIRNKLPENQTREIKIYLTKIIISPKNMNKKETKFRIVSPRVVIDDSTKKYKRSLILSFDGITSDDLVKHSDSTELFPNISNFAKENFFFKNAITSSTVTASSAAALMTGLSLPEHQIYIYDDYFLSPDIISISSSIKTIGEKMANKQINSNGIFAFGRWAPQYGFSRGFNQYRSVNSGTLQNYPWLEESIKLISNNINNSFLFAMHHPGGHPPYLSTITNKYDNLEYSAYEENMKYTDSFFGAIINHLKKNKIYDDTLIIFLADHGRSLSNEFSRQKYQFTENRLRVPLIIKNPDWKDKSPFALNEHISAQASVHDIVCKYMGIKEEFQYSINKRNINGITWVCETIDYSRDNYLGLVGYDEVNKYVLYYPVDFKLFVYQDPIDLQVFQRNSSGIIEEKGENPNLKERNKIIESSRAYLESGLLFAKHNPVEILGGHTHMTDKLI